MTGRGIWNNLWLLKCLAIKTIVLNVTTVNFFFSFLTSCHSFFFSTGCLPLCSNCWLIPMGASSEFRFLRVIFRGRKDKREHVTKTTADTFTVQTGLGSMEKKACNYVSSLTVIQLPDYRDATCASCQMHPNRSNWGTNGAGCKHLSDNSVS